MGQLIVTIVGLAAAKVALLTVVGITSPEGVMILENDDIPLLLPRALIPVRRSGISSS
jgi:hypothetical protein